MKNKLIEFLNKNQLANIYISFYWLAAMTFLFKTFGGTFDQVTILGIITLGCYSVLVYARANLKNRKPKEC